MDDHGQPNLGNTSWFGGFCRCGGERLGGQVTQRWTAVTGKIPGGRLSSKGRWVRNAHPTCPAPAANQHFRDTLSRCVLSLGCAARPHASGRIWACCAQSAHIGARAGSRSLYISISPCVCVCAVALAACVWSCARLRFQHAAARGMMWHTAAE